MSCCLLSYVGCIVFSLSWLWWPICSLLLFSLSLSLFFPPDSWAEQAHVCNRMHAEPLGGKNPGALWRGNRAKPGLCWPPSHLRGFSKTAGMQGESWTDKLAQLAWFQPSILALEAPFQSEAMECLRKHCMAGQKQKQINPCVWAPVQAGVFLAPSAPGKFGFNVILCGRLISGVVLGGCQYICRVATAHLKSRRNQLAHMGKWPGYCEYEIWVKKDFWIPSELPLSYCTIKLGRKKLN